MREVDVDPIESEAVEAGFDLPHHPLAREALIPAGLHRRVGLGDDRRQVSGCRDPLPDRRLAAPAAVGVGGVERPDLDLPGGVHDLERFLVRLALAKEFRRRTDPAEVPTAEHDP